MRILIVGASGLIGSHILWEAKARYHHVLGTYRNFEVKGLKRLDLGDESSTNALVTLFQPDWVVYSAGYTSADACENNVEQAFRENCQQPAMLAQLCYDKRCRFVYVSTTYVFDGNAGPYTEDSKPNPINIYGKSKWAAEQRIQQIFSGTALIPRVICVWGKEGQQKNFVYQTIRALREFRTLRIPSDQIGNPTWAGDIAGWLLSLMEHEQSAVWNLAGSEETLTREDWFCKIRDFARSRLLVPQTTNSGYIAIPTVDLKQPALRPLHAGVSIAKIMSFERRSVRLAAELSPILERTK